MLKLLQLLLLMMLLLLLLVMIGSIESSLVAAGLGMQRRLLSAAVAAVALVSVPTLSSGLSAVTGPIHCGVRRSLDLLLHHDDLVLVLNTAASVAVLAAARVIL